MKFEDTLWPTIRCEFFLRFRSKKNAPSSPAFGEYFDCREISITG